MQIAVSPEAMPCQRTRPGGRALPVGRRPGPARHRRPPRPRHRAQGRPCSRGRRALPATGRSPGRSVALIFQKPSLRTRVSFEVGISRLGGTPVVLVGEEVGLGSREAPRDVAQTLERYVDAIVARVFDHCPARGARRRRPSSRSSTRSRTRSIPCQALADLMVLRRAPGATLAGRQLVYVGDGNNVAASLLLAGASLGLHVRVVGPEGYEPDAAHRGAGAGASPRRPARASSWATTRSRASRAPTRSTRTSGRAWARRSRRSGAATSSGRTRSRASCCGRVPDALVMHCLPAHRGDEIDVRGARRPDAASCSTRPRTGCGPRWRCCSR